MGIITISRGSYNRGKEIAQKLSEKLGYECISREILLKASEDFNVPEVKIIHAIQDAPSVLDRLKHGKKKYIAFIREALLDHIQKDNVLYHGLAGHFFTKDIPNILKIRITANIDYRINAVMKRDNVSNEKARELLNNLSRRACFQTTTESKNKLKDMLIAAEAYSIIVDKFPDANVKSKDGVIFISIESSLSVEEKLSKKFEKLLKNIDGVKEVKTFVIPFDT